MKECPFKEYCDGNCETCTDEYKAERVQLVKEAIQPILANLLEVICPIIEQALEAFNQLWNILCRFYPNKRVVHLALYHPKKMVRKKNIKRIFREYKKYENQT